MRRYLKQFNDGSNLHELPTEVLEDRFWHEIQTAELVHNFGSSGATANCGFDLTIPMGVNSTQFWNQWQLQALGLVRTIHRTRVVSAASCTVQLCVGAYLCVCVCMRLRVGVWV